MLSSLAVLKWNLKPESFSGGSYQPPKNQSIDIPRFFLKNLPSLNSFLSKIDSFWSLLEIWSCLSFGNTTATYQISHHSIRFHQSKEISSLLQVWKVKSKSLFILETQLATIKIFDFAFLDIQCRNCGQINPH